MDWQSNATEEKKNMPHVKQTGIFFFKLKHKFKLHKQTLGGQAGQPRLACKDIGKSQFHTSFL